MNEPSSVMARIGHGSVVVLTVIALIIMALLAAGLLWVALTGKIPFSKYETHLELRDNYDTLDWGAIIIRAVAVPLAIGFGLLAFLSPGVVDLPNRWHSATVGEGMITHGEVIAKNHTDAWTQMIPMTSTVNGITITTMTPIYHPESWTVTIEGVSSADNLRQRQISTNEHNYDQVSIGDQWPPVPGT